MDFLIFNENIKNGVVEIAPDYLCSKSNDLMIRGHRFYAIWNPEKGMWCEDEDLATSMIDLELEKELAAKKDIYPGSRIRGKKLKIASSGSMAKWHTYCRELMNDNFKPLNQRVLFSNSKITKKDHASKTLDYPLEEGKTDAYDHLMSVIYSDEERHKIEWTIGAIVNGDNKTLQKFLVLYGGPGTGKSTVLNIIQMLFDGYYSVFDAEALGDKSNQFALQPFTNNPVVAIQHDGDLSRLETNTRLNSLVSHEYMVVNPKGEPAYTDRFFSILFIGTNKPVKISDAKSGILRRLIDVTPTGKKVSFSEYRNLMKQIKFELGAIAYHCHQVYLEDPDYYDSYVPINMMGASNDFYNFVSEYYFTFKEADGTTLKQAWEMYKTYCTEARVLYPYPQRAFKEELKNYFYEYYERYKDEARTRNYYKGFNTKKFENVSEDIVPAKKKDGWLALKEQHSLLDDELSLYPAQYAGEEGTPSKRWSNVKTRLKDIDTAKLHYVKVPENHIVIDFDIQDENGNKSFEKNLEATKKWPATYAELSKSGAGIHLHYIYSGDVTKLSRVYDESIEVKVFLGNSSLRRMLTKCNDIPIATINSGLPLKGEKMVNQNVVKSEKGLRTLIKRNLNKEIHPGTKPSIDFIYKILEDAYSSDLVYDVTDMRNGVLAFAASSTHQADYCIKLVNKMQFKSAEPSTGSKSDNTTPLIFYDVEIFPNLFICNWKVDGEGKPVVRMINPTPTEIEELIKYRLVGFNCRRYDNHILYARLMGYTNEQLYNLSKRIVSGSSNCFFGEAYNLSYTDIYDFASAGNKKSLKKLEIDMDIHHQELGLDWDKPVPEELWTKVAEYCDNDVIATEAAFHYLNADWTARQILSDLTGMSVNDTTNSLTQRIIFGSERKPQGSFNYRNLAEPVMTLDADTKKFLEEACPEMMAQTHGEAHSLLPYFSGYKYEAGVSTYRGEEVGEGGYVYAEPGMYGNVALLDISSMHPHSLIAEVLFGVKYTTAFRDIVEGRVSIKHEDWDTVNKMLDGKLKPYVQRVINGEMSSKDLANALKTAINSVYGLTSANFENPFRDPRNKDNIVAKRGALFMIELKYEVQKRGFTVAHIKTDSIKIPDATPEIIEFVMNFGRQYGYTFEHEATYEKMCLVNDAVYIAKYKDYDKWTATGTQFQVPYVFKTLFSKEPLVFKDMCETKSVSSTLYLDFNEQLPDVSMYEKDLSKAESDHKKCYISDEKFESIKAELTPKIEKGHSYRFIGQVGQFCPVKSGNGGGLLMREKDGKYYAATGTKGFRWLESEMVRNLDKDIIDRQYYNNLVDDAVNTISKYGDFEWFVSEDPYKPDNPPWTLPCGETKYNTCFDCPHFNQKLEKAKCGRNYDISKTIIEKAKEN